MTAPRLYLITAPSGDVVTFEEMQAHLRVEDDDEQDKIEALTSAAVRQVDGITGIGRALLDQTWEMRLSDFSSCPIEVPLPPLIEVVSITYYDDDNALQTLSTGIYEVVGAGGHSPARIALKSDQSWPTVYDRLEPVIVRFRCGYVDGDSPSVSVPGTVPTDIKRAIMLWAEYLFDGRAALGEKPPVAVDALLQPYRVLSF